VEIGFESSLLSPSPRAWLLAAGTDFCLSDGHDQQHRRFGRGWSRGDFGDHFIVGFCKTAPD
jgi:hypothetical protein